jgi:chlorophyllide a reductase subunit Y
MGPAGAGSLAQVVNAAMAGRDRMASMRDFFEGVGRAETAGVWQDTPVDNPGFKARYAAKRLAAAKAQESIGT